MLDSANPHIAIASILLVVSCLLYTVLSGLWRDIMAPQNMERSHRYLASTIVATAAFGIATVVIMHFGAKRIFSDLTVCLMLAGLAMEVLPGTLLNPAKKLDEADHVTNEDASSEPE